MTRLATILIVISAIAGGCANPFSSRDSAPPTEDVGTYITPTQAEYVLFNIEAAYNERIIINYDQSLHQDFSFIFEQQPAGTDSDTIWNRNTELAITDRIFSNFNAQPNSMSLAVSITESFPPVIEDTVEIIYREYELMVIDQIETGMPDTTIYTGTAEFHIVQTGGSLWALHKWYDRPGEIAEQSWAAFKYQYR